MSEVNFNGWFSESKYCECDSCNNIDRVAIIEIPVTKFTIESNYTDKEIIRKYINE